MRAHLFVCVFIIVCTRVCVYEKVFVYARTHLFRYIKTRVQARAHTHTYIINIFIYQRASTHSSVEDDFTKVICPAAHLTCELQAVSDFQL